MSALPNPGGRTLLAAGGQERELFLALYSNASLSTSSGSALSSARPVSQTSSARANAADSPSALPKEGSWDDGHFSGDAEKEPRERDSSYRRKDRYSREIWKHYSRFEYPASINNSVMLYFPPAMHPSELDNPWAPQADLGGFCRANSTLPRLVISNNDCTVKFLDISLEKGGFGTYPKETWHGMGRGHKLEDKRFVCVGILKLPVPVNHSELPFLAASREYIHAY